MKVFINDKEYNANPDETIIELCDKVGIHIPRFCYHKHLSVVASCRMCLVDVEGVKYAQPACSTPLRDEMRVSTGSEKTKIAQKNSMEFLLINHPLDCPICDQGGECELQDISLEHGDDHSQYMQFKRVVVDKDISPLISTDMTRCIHCSRCVRFGEEISNVKELGLLNRGEDMKIDVFIEEGVSSELSANMIDLCPVGALNNKPYRYKARTWDLKQICGISPHDCIGSNINYHIYNNKIVRAVPSENSEINQTWLSDRDRFGYEGIYAKDRAEKTLIKVDGKLVEIDFDSMSHQVNDLISKNIKEYGQENIGCLISGQSTSEEHFLFQKIFKKLGITNIDHRTKESDFSYQDSYPIMPSLGCNLNDLKKYKNIILVGVNVKTEYPVLSIRLNALAKNNTKVYSFNFNSLEENFSLHHKQIITHDNIDLFLNTSNFSLENGETLFIIGPSVSRSPNQSSILRKISEFSSSIDANIGFLTEFCNSTSGWLLGNLPHRELGGGKPRQIGKNSYEMIKSHLSSYIFYNLEPEFDFFNKQDLEHALDTSKCNIFFTSYITPIIEKYADIIIPITTFAETDGGYINIEGTYQTFQPIVQPSKNIHVGWSILNDILKLNNLGDYSIDEIRGELAESLDGLNFSTPVSDMSDINSNNDMENVIVHDLSRETNETDLIVRRSESLRQVSLMNKKINNKNIISQSDNLQTNVTK
ncbi:MAG: NADH-quinone oxidoreductase subunit NuoG [Gammaproteobacteria bacterium]|nr:NADH-quinone oxidoreductase subunit NuoG [Gammaproteobacteria bacterium]|tara:strand:- start:1760 stop:3874 length:2115 start_codon:yes stop_codon:yes gene_type:complete